MRTQHLTRDLTRALVVLTGVAFVGVAPAFARSTVQDPGEAAPRAANDDEQRAQKRVLHLAGGSTLRRVARKVDSGWEYKQGGKWVSLPAGAVTDTALEKDVARELDRRLKEADGDVDQRAAAGDWALEAGLLEEGLTQLEFVFQDDPDHAAARAAVGRHADRFAVPRVPYGCSAADDVVEGLVRWAAGRAHASRELALIELAKVGDRDGLAALLGGELENGSVRRRSFAAHAIRRLYPGEAVKPLLVHAVLDTSEDVRKQSAYALKQVGDEALAVPVIRALGSSNGRVRGHAAEALGHMGYKAAVAPLVATLARLQNLSSGHSVPHANIFIGRQFAFIQDFDVEVAQFQAVANPEVNVLVEGQVTDAGVRGVERIDTVVHSRRVIMNSLRQLTGANPGRGANDWLEWWEDNKSAYLDAPRTRGGR